MENRQHGYIAGMKSNHIFNHACFTEVAEHFCCASATNRLGHFDVLQRRSESTHADSQQVRPRRRGLESRSTLATHPIRLCAYPPAACNLYRALRHSAASVAGKTILHQLRLHCVCFISCCFHRGTVYTYCPLIYATADEADVTTRIGLCFTDVFFLFFFAFSVRHKNTRQPFSGTAARIFMKLLPNDSGEMEFASPYSINFWGLKTTHCALGGDAWRVTRN